MTNDGMLAHELLSPGRHVEKVYECTIREPLTVSQIQALQTGVDIGEKKPALPAGVTVLEDRKIVLTITEGKFHQVKRMLKAVGNEVLYLKRIRMGSLTLDNTLRPGEYDRPDPHRIYQGTIQIENNRVKIGKLYGRMRLLLTDRGRMDIRFFGF